MSGFKSAQAKEKPKLSCIGRVAGVELADKEKTGITKSEKYLNLRFQLQGYGASNNTRVDIYYRPEWLVPGFDPTTLEAPKDADEATQKALNGQLALYRKHFLEEGKVSTLLGLCGGDAETFDALAAKLFAIDVTGLLAKGDEGIKALPHEVLKVVQDFFDSDEAKAGQRVGYILQQQQQKTDEVDADGKAIYVRTQYYEVGDGRDNSGFWIPDEKGRKAQQSRGSRSDPSKFRITWTEEDTPF